MKRPEGFRKGQPPPRPRPAEPRPAPRTTPKLVPGASKPARAPKIRPSRAGRPDAQARSEFARAARERRRAERAELKRFTRRTRHRRIVLISAAGLLAAVVALVVVAVYSPLLALRTIVVEGTSRIPAADVQAAVSGQLGTPLALVDLDQLQKELTAFPLIRSYVTEAVPPDTLVIHIVERQPVGQVPAGAGFELVDPAGVTIAQSPQRVPGYPIIEATDLKGTAFRSMVEVLLALPAGLLPIVERVSATTQDDVTLVLTGVGQQVRWGSAEDSETKARVLASLIAAVNDPSRPGVFEVSAPGTAVFRPL